MTQDFRSAYYLNFMFGQLPPSMQSKKAIMREEVMRVYATLLTREVRRPRSSSAQGDMPRFFGCPDLPVPKRNKCTKRLTVANEGMHFNGILVLSNLGRGQLNPELDLPREPYVRSGGHLERVHVTPIEHDSMASYTFKTVERYGHWDDILVLPRSRSELANKRLGERALD